MRKIAGRNLSAGSVTAARDLFDRIHTIAEFVVCCGSRSRMNQKRRTFSTYLPGMS
jgi:hypothetical protein